ncbi:MAG: taurine dioxygenase [Balneola sp.]|eukprot:CAMPEP_0201973934 /NCGR_PEP_ID=MMETSP0904-20121228/48221_1 /ASSEMBLY_ACC=CAM_ASM_000553 /TAXON_ID=420261 /ORGANISM="Thalassiosira antarctica, Strain CCMP982" /LENGTH=113 /DNA_ID=CAMNT_0048524275 /DNA_START=390 /DNA_END=731 /DNA_ORIENTATION=-
MAKLIDFSSLNDMLYGDEKYIKEFAEAAMISFSEFNSNYSKFLSKRDEENLRRAGHKIKPVAQMLGIQQLIDEYEVGKTIIWEEKSDEELNKSIERIDSICSQVLNELENMVS